MIIGQASKTEGEMQVICPNCGEKVTAQHINIQKMTAICPACDSVFPIELPEPKAKRRKVKQPGKLTLRDTETLQMDFRTNFRLERNGAAISSAYGSVSMTFLALLFIAEHRVSLILPLIFLLIAVALVYRLALTVVNKTHIEMDEGAIKVTREPIPNPFNRGYEVALAGVAAIKYEETAISKKEAYDTPRYRVWAETVDGSSRTIVTDVIEEYAVFIAQRLQEHLEMDDNFDMSRLGESEPSQDDGPDVHEAVRPSQNHATLK
jgi:hypothetical protein